jgi:molecular chaperone DnaK
LGNVIGIDLGTSNSCVAVVKRGTPQVIPNPLGSRTTPSVLAMRNGEKIVGHPARWQASSNPRNTVWGLHRILGHAFSSPEVQRARKTHGYEIVEASNGDAHVRLEGRVYSLPELLAIFIGYLKSAAEGYLEETVDYAVIAVPACFNYKQCEVMRHAAAIAGLEVLRVMNAANATALAYGVLSSRPGRIAVYDLGGGTFDISVLELRGGIYQVLSSGGDSGIGGMDIDQLVVQWMVDSFRQKTGIDLTRSSVARQKLYDTAEKAKCFLSTEKEATIQLPCVLPGATKEVPLRAVLTRDRLERMVEVVLEKTRETYFQALVDAGVWSEDVDDVILVGGQTRSPVVSNLVCQSFQRQPNRSINRNEVVALGAAIHAGSLNGELSDFVLLDVSPHTLGVESHDLIPIDIIASSFETESAKRCFTPLIERNAAVPTRKSRLFTTTKRDQTQIELNVLENEIEGDDDVFRFIPDRNRVSKLGKLQFQLPPAQRQERQVEVSFSLGVNRIVEVEAHDGITGKELLSRWISSPRTRPCGTPHLRATRTLNHPDSKKAVAQMKDGPLFFLDA